MAAIREPIFWDIGGYRANVKRIKDGADSLDDYAKMVKERVDIEQKYGKSLLTWHSKWNTYVEQSLVDSVVKDSWTTLMEESKELARTHMAVRERCNDELLKTIQLFRKDNYHHSTIRGFREAKETEDEFEKAQRPWKKLYDKMESARKVYYLACRTEKSTSIQLMNLQGDASTVNESTDKIKERQQKCKEDVIRSRNSYQFAVTELSQYATVYNENMAFVFEKCQQMELKRIRFAMEMLSGLQQILVDLANSPKLNQLHDQLAKMFTETNESEICQDLRSWAKVHGVGAELKCPVFEEYTPEMRQITNNNTTLKAAKRQDTGGVILMKQKITSDELPGTPTIAASLERQSALLKYPENLQRRGTLTSQVSTTSHEQKRLRKDHGDSPGLSRREPNTDSCQANASWNNSQTRSLDEELKDEAFLQSQAVSDKESGDDEEILEKTLTVEMQSQKTKSSNSYPENGFTEKRHPMQTPFQAPFPMPTPNRALMNATGDTCSPITRSQRTSSLQMAPSLTSMLAMEKKEPNQHSTSIYNHISPKSQSDSGNSNGSVESDGVQSMPRGPARVLFDYSPIEEDEIPLKKGEVLEVLHGPDDLGWCYGRKGALQGLFPASYVSVI